MHTKEDEKLRLMTSIRKKTVAISFGSCLKSSSHSIAFLYWYIVPKRYWKELSRLGLKSKETAF